MTRSAENCCSKGSAVAKEIQEGRPYPDSGEGEEGVTSNLTLNDMPEIAR